MGLNNVTVYQHLKILVLDTLLRKICLQILSWKVTGITFRKESQLHGFFRFSVCTLTIVYKLKCLY